MLGNAELYGSKGDSNVQANGEQGLSGYVDWSGRLSDRIEYGGCYR